MPKSSSGSHPPRRTRRVCTKSTCDTVSDSCASRRHLVFTIVSFGRRIGVRQRIAPRTQICPHAACLVRARRSTAVSRASKLGDVLACRPVLAVAAAHLLPEYGTVVSSRYRRVRCPRHKSSAGRGIDRLIRRVHVAIRNTRAGDLLVARHASNVRLSAALDRLEITRGTDDVHAVLNLIATERARAAGRVRRKHAWRYRNCSGGKRCRESENAYE